MVPTFPQPLRQSCIRRNILLEELKSSAFVFMFSLVSWRYYSWQYSTESRFLKDDYCSLHSAHLPITGNQKWSTHSCHIKLIYSYYWYRLQWNMWSGELAKTIKERISHWKMSSHYGTSCSAMHVWDDFGN